MPFLDLIEAAQAGDDSAFEALFEMYRPLIRKYSTVDGIFDEDLWQEQCLRFLLVLKKFHYPYSG